VLSLLFVLVWSTQDWFATHVLTIDGTGATHDRGGRHVVAFKWNEIADVRRLRRWRREMIGIVPADTGKVMDNAPTLLRPFL
tara:strand:+ start:372 stop:617 length:246 start_codon:yes stop_codon:yes gene_type:complete